MKVNKSIGEVGIKIGERSYKLRPSFYALSHLGSPQEIVRKFRSISWYFECLSGMRKFPIGVDPVCGHSLCREIIEACIVGDSDPYDLTGSTAVVRGHVKHRKQALPYHDLVVLAFHLMRYGIYGNPKPRKKQDGGSERELTEFDPSEAVGMAVGQFGMSLSDAWNLTMIEYQRAWDGKYPEQDDTKEQQRVSQEEYSELMDWHDQVKAAQAKAAKQ